MEYTHPPLLDAAIGFGGVILGGLITLGINLLTAWLDERKKRLGIAYSIKFKVQSLSDLIVKLHRHFQKDLQGHKGPLWATLRGYAGSGFHEIVFNAEELSLLAQFGES